MNWVGGSRNRIKLSEEEKKKKEFFERQRQRGKEAVASSSKSGVVSQDIISMKTVDKVNRNPWHLNTKGDAAKRAKIVSDKKSQGSRLHHVDMSPVLGKPGQVQQSKQHSKQILNRVLRGPSAVPTWSTYLKKSSDSREPQSPERSGSNTSASIFDTSSSVPYTKLSNTPMSARVKRQPSESDRPSSFFEELPEFKRLKSSENFDRISSSKFGESSTPGYKNGQYFQRNSRVSECDEGKSRDIGGENALDSFSDCFLRPSSSRRSQSVASDLFQRNSTVLDEGKSDKFDKENVLVSLSESLPKPSSSRQNQYSSSSITSNIPKPVFSNSANPGPRKNSDIWRLESATKDNLSSLLAAPKADTKHKSSKRTEVSKLTDTHPRFKSKRQGNCYETFSEVLQPIQSSKSSQLDDSLPAFGILDETRNTFPPEYHFSDYVKNEKLDTLQDTSFLASQRVSQDMLDKRFRHSWLSMNDTPQVSKPTISQHKKIEMFGAMDESRDLFSEETAISSRPVPMFTENKSADLKGLTPSLFNSYQTKSEPSVMNEATLLNETISCDQEIPSASGRNRRKTDYIPEKLKEPDHETSILSLSPLEGTVCKKSQPIKISDASVQTEKPTETLTCVQELKSMYFSIIDHSYCKSTIQQKMLLRSLQNLKSLKLETVKSNVETQTVEFLIPEQRVREKSDSQHSKSPPPKDHDLEEIIHFGETDYSSELEVVDSTPRHDSPPSNDSATTDSCSQTGNRGTSNEKCHQVAPSTTDQSLNISSPKTDQLLDTMENEDFDSEMVDAAPISDYAEQNIQSENSTTIESPSNKSLPVLTQDYKVSSEHSTTDTLPDSQSLKPKPRPIIWPDEQLFFVKLPDAPDSSELESIEREMELSRNSMMQLDHDKDKACLKAVEPENMVLRIENSKPSKTKSPQRKFVPFFTSQTVRKPVAKGTVEDPIKLSPEKELRDFVQQKTPKKSPFMIVGRKSSSSTELHPKKAEDEPQCSGSKEKALEDKQELSLIYGKCTPRADDSYSELCKPEHSESKEPERTDKAALAETNQIDISTVADDEADDETGNQNVPLAKYSNNHVPQCPRPIFYSQRSLVNKKLVVLTSSQPNTVSCSFQQSSKPQTLSALQCEE